MLLRFHRADATQCRILVIDEEKAMLIIRILIAGLLVLAGATLTFAQTDATEGRAVRSAPTVTISFSTKGVRFTAFGNVKQMRLEVFDANGGTLFNSDFQAGNLRDWAMEDKQGQRLPDGTYLCVVTTRDLSGRLDTRQGMIVRQNGQAVLQLSDGAPVGAVEPDKALAPVAEANASAVTLATHNGQEGQVISTRGGLTFRAGDFFAGQDKELMRLTPEGNFGIGIAHRQVRLEVDGLIRATQGIVFPDGS